jgi:hypothetical protein
MLTLVASALKKNKAMVSYFFAKNSSPSLNSDSSAMIEKESVNINKSRYLIS